MGTFGKRRTGPWYAEERSRIVLEARAADYFPGLRRTFSRLGGKEGLRYDVILDVPYYEPRAVKVFFPADRSGDSPIIIADGPTCSPHRYSGFDRRQLCIWHPGDPPEERWLRRDGMVTLLALVKLHLFREAWWRDTGCGEWLGPQALHGSEEKITDD